MSLLFAFQLFITCTIKSILDTLILFQDILKEVSCGGLSYCVMKVWQWSISLNAGKAMSDASYVLLGTDWLPQDILSQCCVCNITVTSCCGANHHLHEVHYGWRWHNCWWVFLIVSMWKRKAKQSLFISLTDNSFSGHIHNYLLVHVDWEFLEQ